MFSNGRYTDPDTVRRDNCANAAEHRREAYEARGKPRSARSHPLPASSKKDVASQRVSPSSRLNVFDIMEERGLKPRECGGAGECGPKSIAYELQKVGFRRVDYLGVRVLTSEFMKSNYDGHFEYGWTKSKREYMEYCQKVGNGEWFDDLSLSAAAMAFDVQIELFDTHSNTVRIRNENPERPMIRLLYRDNNHYQAVE